MLVKRPPMSNLERQRKFRQRHPGYFKKYYARKKAAGDALVAQNLPALRALYAAVAAAATAESPPPLLRPAPADLPPFPALPAAPAREPLPVQTPANIAA